MAINFTNKSSDDIYMDIDNINQYASQIKKTLSGINDDLVALKNIYNNFANDSKTKGKMKAQAQKIVSGCSKYINKNTTVRQSLNSQINKSANEYINALRAFDELGSYADQLGNE